jgi:hypothetical protein
VKIKREVVCVITRAVSLVLADVWEQLTQLNLLVQKT